MVEADAGSRYAWGVDSEDTMRAGRMGSLEAVGSTERGGMP